jgi:hypothetical protein
MKYYTQMKTSEEIEKETVRLAELLDVAKSNIPAMCISIVSTYFADKQVLMEAPTHLPKDGRRKK